MAACNACGKDHSVGRPEERPGITVERDLRLRLEAGEWKSGEQLPSVAEFAEHYGVANRTVSRVLRTLADDGLVRLVPRWGTFKT
jgi:GntR family transcriptional regulator